MPRSLLLILVLGLLSAEDKPSGADKVENNPQLSALKSGELFDFGAAKVTTPAGEPENKGRLITDYSGMAYDPKRHRMLLFGGGHASTNYDGIAVIDLKDLAWKEEYAPTPIELMVPENYDSKDGIWKKGPSGPYPRPAARHTVDLIQVVNDELVLVTYVEGNGRGLPGAWQGKDPTLWVKGGNASQYDLEKKTWTFGDDAEYTWPGSDVDPKTGNIVTLGYRGLHVYDPKARTLSTVIDATKTGILDENGAPIGPGLTYNVSLTYFPPDDCFYYITSEAVFRLKFNREKPEASTVTKVPTTGAPPSERPTKCAYDSSNQLIGTGPWKGVFYAFDPKKSAWTSKTLSKPELNLAWMALEFDPVDGVYIFVTEWNASTGNAYAFKW
jgi:hypothetical protein